REGFSAPQMREPLAVNDEDHGSVWRRVALACVIVAICLLIVASILLSSSANAETHRDAHQRALFIKSHPCPANGKTRGACPGYVVDHIKPLCAGGPDRPPNMQWQTVAEAKKKDRLEAQECRTKRR